VSWQNGHVSPTQQVFATCVQTWTQNHAMLHIRLLLVQVLLLSLCLRPVMIILNISLWLFSVCSIPTQTFLQVMIDVCPAYRTASTLNSNLVLFWAFQIVLRVNQFLHTRRYLLLYILCHNVSLTQIIYRPVHRFFRKGLFPLLICIVCHIWRRLQILGRLIEKWIL
jgi:hypothetical protein